MSTLTAICRWFVSFLDCWPGVNLASQINSMHSWCQKMCPGTRQLSEIWPLSHLTMTTLNTDAIRLLTHRTLPWLADCVFKNKVTCKTKSSCLIFNFQISTKEICFALTSLRPLKPDQYNKYSNKFSWTFQTRLITIWVNFNLTLKFHSSSFSFWTP